jgi:hypothetical protein
MGRKERRSIEREERRQKTKAVDKEHGLFCDICFQEIKDDDEVVWRPGKYIRHRKCHITRGRR